MSKSGKLITLKNFNPNSKKAPFLTSPRSCQACNEQGVDPSQLLRKSKAEIKALLIQNGRAQDDETVRQMGDHLEQRRKAKLDVLLKAREAIIAQERKSVSRQSNKKSRTGGDQDENKLNLLEMEKRVLEKVKQKQQLEVRKMIEFEIKQEMAARKNREKQEFLMKRKQDMDKQARLKKAQDEEKKRKLAIHRAQQAEADRQAAEQAKYQMEKDEDARNKMKNTQKQKRLAKQADNQRMKTQKKLKFQKQVQDKLMEQQLQIQQQRDANQKREMERERKMQEKQRDMQLASQKLAEKRNLQIAKCREHQELQNEQARMSYQSRQQLAMKRKMAHDKRIEKEKNDKAKRAYAKQVKINSNLDAAKQARHEYNMQIMEHEDLQLRKYQEYQGKMAIEMANAKQVLLAKNERLRQVRVQNDMDQANRVQGIKNTLNQTETKVHKSRMALQARLDKQKEQKFLKRMDHTDNISRIEKIKELKKRQIMEKIEKDNQRMAMIMTKKQKMMDMKFQLLRELDFQRQAIMEDFELKKSKNQLDIYAYAKEFNINIEEIQNELARGHESKMGQSRMSNMSKKSKQKKSPAKKVKTKEAPAPKPAQSKEEPAKPAKTTEDPGRN